MLGKAEIVKCLTRAHIKGNKTTQESLNRILVLHFSSFGMAWKASSQTTGSSFSDILLIPLDSRQPADWRPNALVWLLGCRALTAFTS